MTRRAVGLDIGTHAVHVAEVTLTRGQPTLTNFGGVPLPRGAVAEGEVVDVDTVASAVRELWAEAGLKADKVHLGVANQHVVVRQVDLPFMPDDELRSALRFQVQEHIPIAVEQAELDYQRVEEFTADNGERMVRILLVAAERDMVANHVAVAEKAGLRPVGVDLNAFAVLRTLVPDPEAVAGSRMLVDVGEGVTNIVIHEGGVPRFVRILVLGGGDITEGLETSLGLAHEEAEERKRKLGLSPNGEAGRVIDQRTAAFVDELRGSLDFYLAQSGATQVTGAVLSGGGSKLAGLDERLERVLRIPAEAGHPLQWLPVKGSEHGERELAAVEPLLVTAVGLALGGVL